MTKVACMLTVSPGAKVVGSIPMSSWKAYIGPPASSNQKLMVFSVGTSGT